MIGGLTSKLERIVKSTVPILAANILLFSSFFYGCNPKDGFSTDDDSFTDDDSAWVDDDSGDDDSSDDDSSGDDDDDIINLCPHSEKEVYFTSGIHFLGGHYQNDLEYIPYIIAEGNFVIEKPYCAEKYPFPGEGYNWIGMHDTPEDGLTFAKVLAIKKAIPDLFGRSLCTSTQYLRMAAGPNNLPFSYGTEYDVTACDVADNPEHPIGHLETCCTEEGVCEVGTRSYWTNPDDQMMTHYNSSADELGWTFLGGDDPAYLVEDAEIVASGGVNFKTTAFYGYCTNGIHWHFYVGDPYTEGNPDNEFDDDYIRFCLDPDNQPTKEQDELYGSIRSQCGEQGSFEPLLALINEYENKELEEAENN
jgi:hypothetical protein